MYTHMISIRFKTFVSFSSGVSTVVIFPWLTLSLFSCLKVVEFIGLSKLLPFVVSPPSVVVDSDAVSSFIGSILALYAAGVMPFFDAFFSSGVTLTEHLTTGDCFDVLDIFSHRPVVKRVLIFRCVAGKWFGLKEISI